MSLHFDGAYPKGVVNTVLSIDVTDRRIKLVKGVFSGGKVKVLKAAAVDLEKGLVANGFVGDAAQVAQVLTAALRKNGLNAREAVVSITSNLIVFKELRIPAARNDELSFMVHNQMQHSMGISDEYCISYTVMGDVEVEGATMRRILATACPQRLINTYKQLFALMGVRLRAAYVSSICFARLLPANERYRTSTTLLAVQVDRDFIGLNIFSQRQLAFAKYVKIEESDYEGEADYVATAAAEHVFRMIQFYRNSFRDVVVYGDIRNEAALAAALESFDVTVYAFGMPRAVTIPSGIDPLLYANAIGALYKPNKATERVNLLEASPRGGRARSSFAVGLVGLFAVSVLLVGLVYFLLSLQIDIVNRQIAVIDAYIGSPEVTEQLAEFDRKRGILNKLRQYAADALTADDAFTSKPTLDAGALGQLEANLGSDVRLLSVEQNGERLTASFAATTQSAPAAYVKRLTDSGFFDDVAYTGYDGSGVVGFTLVLMLKGGEAQ